MRDFFIEQRLVFEEVFGSLEELFSHPLLRADVLERLTRKLGQGQPARACAEEETFKTRRRDAERFEV